MSQFQQIIGQFSFKKKILLLTILVLAVGLTFLTFGDSTELRNLIQLVLQLGQIIVDDLGSDPKIAGNDVISVLRR